jgi:hypothetical protein
MKGILKNIIQNSLSDIDLIISKENQKRLKILSMTCFWSKKNFSAILKFYGKKYYTYFDNNLNDIIIENA